MENKKERVKKQKMFPIFHVLLVHKKLCDRMETKTRITEYKKEQKNAICKVIDSENGTKTEP